MEVSPQPSYYPGQSTTNRYSQVSQSMAPVAQAPQPATEEQLVVQCYSKYIELLEDLNRKMGPDAKALPAQYCQFMLLLAGQVAGVANSMKHTIGRL